MCGRKTKWLEKARLVHGNAKLPLFFIMATHERDAWREPSVRGVVNWINHISLSVRHSNCRIVFFIVFQVILASLRHDVQVGGTTLMLSLAHSHSL